MCWQKASSDLAPIIPVIARCENIQLKVIVSNNSKIFNIKPLQLQITKLMGDTEKVLYYAPYYLT